MEAYGVSIKRPTRVGKRRILYQWSTSDGGCGCQAGERGGGSLDGRGNGGLRLGSVTKGDNHSLPRGVWRG